jgi:hypothetical protein
MRRAYRAAIVLALFCGCSSSQKGFSDAGKMPPPLTQVAMDFATWDCTRRFACMPYASEARAFGDTVADCTMQQNGYQTRSLTAPGVSTDYTQILKCVDQMKTASCQQFLDSVLGGDPKAMPDCTAFTPGTIATGAGCAYDRQCITGHCATIAEGQCGKCAKELPLGAGCVPGMDLCDTSMGAICDGLTPGMCILGQRRGDACTTAASCYSNLICDPTTAKCVDPPSSVGDMCDPTVPDGDGCSFQDGAGVVCNTMTMMCELPSQNALGGASCGVSTTSGGLSLCGVGFLCDRSSKDGFSGKCISGHAAPAGQPCAFKGSSANGPACEAEAICSAGKCSLVDPKTCH